MKDGESGYLMETGQKNARKYSALLMSEEKLIMRVFKTAAFLQTSQIFERGHILTLLETPSVVKLAEFIAFWLRVAQVAQERDGVCLMFSLLKASRCK
jgi:hypothetical protein